MVPNSINGIICSLYISEIKEQVIALENKFLIPSDTSFGHVVTSFQ